MAELAYEEILTPEEAYTRDFIDSLHQAVAREPQADAKARAALYQQLIRKCCKTHRITLTKGDIYKIYQGWVNDGKIAPSMIVESLTRTRSVRSWSGVLPISVATDGNTFSCAYDCHFCPNEIVAKGAPRDISRSYLSSEGTFIRGAIEDFSCYRQVWRRLLELEIMGHPPDKCEIIVLGGTWDCYPVKYRDQFITELFYACNTYHRISVRLQGDLAYLTREWLETNPFATKLPFDHDHRIRSEIRPMKDLQFEKDENTHSPCSRIIGIVLETRPDQINKHSLMRKRRLGCTRLQLGIQHTDNSILELNNRGHGVEASIRANREARDAGFKVDGHLMPDLPGTTFEKDMEMIEKVFTGDTLQLDYCKIYPCLDLPYTQTREWKHDGLWMPIAEHRYDLFLEVICHAVVSVPPWTRINRVQRDFPEAQEKNDYLGFVSENVKSNLQQIVMDKITADGQIARDIRTREVKDNFTPEMLAKARPYVRAYRANQGTELFISVEVPLPPHPASGKQPHPDVAALLGLLRLRFCDAHTSTTNSYPAHFLDEFRSPRIAHVRELHVYGNLVQVVQTNTDQRAQHSGVGKFLLAYAEAVAYMLGYEELSVISGVGVRAYYEGMGYTLHGPGEYMRKRVGPNITPISLFGRSLHPLQLCIPVARMTVVQKHLRVPKWTKVPLPRWWSRHVYSEIQGGDPELVVVECEVGFGKWLALLVSVVLLLVALLWSMLL